MHGLAGPVFRPALRVVNADTSHRAFNAIGRLGHANILRSR